MLSLEFVALSNLKPKRWGYIEYLSLVTAMASFNFEVYTGTITRVEGKPDIGASGNMVLKRVQLEH